MPVKVVKKTGKRPWKIVEVATGRVVGTSTSKANAQSSARVRNMVYAGIPLKKTRNRRKSPRRKRV